MLLDQFAAPPGIGCQRDATIRTIDLPRCMLAMSINSWNVPRSSCYRSHVIALEWVSFADSSCEDECRGDERGLTGCSISRPRAATRQARPMGWVRHHDRYEPETLLRRRQAHAARCTREGCVTTPTPSLLAREKHKSERSRSIAPSTAAARQQRGVYDQSLGSGVELGASSMASAKVFATLKPSILGQGGCARRPTSALASP